jgi:HNH endonuclease
MKTTSYSTQASATEQAPETALVFRPQMLRTMVLFPQCCLACGYDEHRNILEIHHIDRDRGNNEAGNLTVLCPNCHRLIHRRDHRYGPWHKRFLRLPEFWAIVSSHNGSARTLPSETVIQSLQTRKGPRVQIRSNTYSSEVLDFLAGLPAEQPCEERHAKKQGRAK